MQTIPRFFLRNNIFRALWFTALAAVLFLPETLHAVSEKILSNPVALGAWLYQNHCGRCHGPYQKERIGSNYADTDRLQKAIERGECRISWGRRYGGKLGGRDIRALSAFMMKWEALNAPPPESLSLPTTAPELAKISGSKDKARIVGNDSADRDKDTLSPDLKLLMKSSPLAHGARLFTRNCFRCHLSYEKARMGRGIHIERVRKTIVNGKTSTQMTPFARSKGGDLSNSEIDAVIGYIAVWEKIGEEPALAPGVTTPPKADPAELLSIGLPKFPRVEGDLANGEILFARNCARCHGRTAEGYIGRRLRGLSGVLRPDLRVKALLKAGAPGSLMPSFSIDSGGALSARQIDDITFWVTRRREQ